MKDKNRHGRYELSHQGQIIVWYGFGSWNEETLTDLHRAVLSIVANFDARPWAFVANATQWELMSPESIIFWQHIQKSLVEHGCICGATVVGENTLKQSVAKKATRDQGIEINTFLDHDEAVRWCERFLADQP
ncbi:hypothetical protein L4C34_11230 [Vibrio profundum]|uniref:hypothetical protein n=1 Tax=Vibrio profundum TaxID=2910247 RepID=UPI003D0D8A15